MGETKTIRDRLTAGTRVAAAATALTVLLAIAKGGIGYWRGSPALIADAIHSGADTLAIFACWIGLSLAKRPPTKRFPFGLYRAETLASLLVSTIILLAGAGMLMENISGLVQGGGPLARSVDVLVVALASAALSFCVFVWERKAGERLHSQSLLANADESRADILTSLAVFVGAGASYVGLAYVELTVAVGLSLLIIWLGVKHARLALYALLDASLDPDLEVRARAIAESVAGVMAVDDMRLRRAGPFCFGVAQISVRKSIDVNRGHELAEQVEHAVIADIHQVERLIVHVEPFRPDVLAVMVPTDGSDLDSPVSDHFGRARFFLFAEVSSKGVQQTGRLENPFRKEPARAALAVVREVLKSRAVDAVLTRQIGEIAFHALRDHYVDIYAAPEGTARNALGLFTDRSLRPVVHPTHPSKGAGAPGPEKGVP